MIALFPGQGSHAVGMAQALHDAYPAARDVMDRSDAVLPGLKRLMFEGPLEDLTMTAWQQPALVAAGAAAYAAWRDQGGTEAVAFAGHSLGEFTAHVAAGSLTLEDAIALVHARGRYMQDAVPPGEGAMAAILKLDAAQVQALCDAAPGRVSIANDNAPAQQVVSGDASAVDAVAEAAKQAGGRAVPLAVSAPFHCPLMQPAAERLAADLARVEFRTPSAPIVCNVTAAPLGRPDEAPKRLTEQVTGTVRWTDTVRWLASEHGTERFLEFGSGKVLTGLVGRIVSGHAAATVHDPESLTHALETHALEEESA
jgi:[acyl-carrier-protein] S-malonyltransferase